MVSDLGQTTVMVTHDAHAAAIADRVLFLADGEIVRDLGPSQRPHHPRHPGRGHGAMIKVALKGLAGRKVRALLTALAVVIGVSMVSGTFVLTDTMQKAFDGIFEESYEGTDAVISGGSVPAPATREGQGACRRRDRRGLDPQDLQENTNPPTLLDQDGEMIGRQGESMGIGVGDDGRAVHAAEAQAGRLGARRQAGRARRRHGPQVRLRRGDTIKIAARARPGLHRPRHRHVRLDRLLGGTSLAIFDVGTAQALFDKAGQFDSISVKAKAAAPRGVTKAIKPLLAKGPVVQTGDAQAGGRKDTNESLKFITSSCSASAASRCSWARS